MESPIVPKIRGQNLWSSVWGGHGSWANPEPPRMMPSAKLLFEIVVGRFQIGLRAFHGAQGVDVTYHNWLKLSEPAMQQGEKTAPRKKMQQKSQCQLFQVFNGWPPINSSTLHSDLPPSATPSPLCYWTSNRSAAKRSNCLAPGLTLANMWKKWPTWKWCFHIWAPGKDLCLENSLLSQQHFACSLTMFTFVCPVFV